MAFVGKQKWRREPEFDRQFQEGREHITCPKCNASMGDQWVEKGEKLWRPVPNFGRQFEDGRRHLTCPKCSHLLGEVYWLPPTIGERVKYICQFTAADMSWRVRWVVSLVIAILAIITILWFAIPESGASLVGYFTLKRIAMLCLSWLMVFGFVWVFLSPHRGNSGDDSWWWWFNNRH